jgi:hypothetical protein
LLRYHQYRALVSLIYKVPGRWPHLFKYLREQRALYLNWWTMLPIMAALAILLIHTGLHRLVWSSARVTPLQLSEFWGALLFVGLSGTAMVGLDVYTLFRFQPLDVPRVEKDLDRAEYWFNSWVGKALNVVTLGTVNPQKMVKTEIRKTIVTSLRSMDRAVAQWMVQIGFRLLFGFSLWYCWARLLQET